MSLAEKVSASWVAKRPIHLSIICALMILWSVFISVLGVLAMFASDNIIDAIPMTTVGMGYIFISILVWRLDKKGFYLAIIGLSVLAFFEVLVISKPADLKSLFFPVLLALTTLINRKNFKSSCA